MSTVLIASRHRRGLTLIEVMIALTLLLLATLGTVAFRYYVSLNTQKAQKQATAARLALLVGESWKGQKGSNTFDAVTNFDALLAIETSGTGPAAPGGHTHLETYKITSEGIHYYLTLSWQQISTDLIEMNIQVAWGHRTHGPLDFSTDDRIYSLTTRVST